MCCIGVRLLLISTTFWCMVVCVVKFYHTLNNDRKVGNMFLSKLSKTGKQTSPLFYHYSPTNWHWHKLTYWPVRSMYLSLTTQSDFNFEKLLIKYLHGVLIWFSRIICNPVNFIHAWNIHNSGSNCTKYEILVDLSLRLRSLSSSKLFEISGSILSHNSKKIWGIEMRN